ncbi:MAG: UPF0280 family protein [Methanomicrobiales archaeon]|nr:UPF0280 family protein [Methanomicrobiales archaeon]
MIREHFEYKTTIATIIAEEPGQIIAAKDGMIAARQEIEAVIAADPFFGATLEPYDIASESLTVRRMVAAGMKAGTGPMAAVAGSIAWAGIEAMQESGASFGIIDNGGDIALIGDREVRVGLYAGDAPISGTMAFAVPPRKGVTGICTSSATVGPSISFGVADAVTVFAADVALADAWATSLCNRTAGPEDELFSPLEGAEIDGAFVVIGTGTYSWGRVPPLVPARVHETAISAGYGGEIMARILRNTIPPDRTPPCP